MCPVEDVNLGGVAGKWRFYGVRGGMVKHVLIPPFASDGVWESCIEEQRLGVWYDPRILCALA